ncbi:MAG: chalcone isomerase family protein [Candidatus Binatia bacterium]
MTFSETIRAGGVAFALSNVAALRWKVFFRPYVGGFYVAEGVDPKRWREDVPKRLELEYFYSIPGKDFGPAGEEVLARNVSAETIAALNQPLAEISRLYVDVKPGDRYALTYLPGRGTELSRNGTPLGTVGGGAEFAAAYYTIWLGGEPISGAFRDQLLTKR